MTATLPRREATGTDQADAQGSGHGVRSSRATPIFASAIP